MVAPATAAPVASLTCPVNSCPNKAVEKNAKNRVLRKAQFRNLICLAPRVPCFSAALPRRANADWSSHITAGDAITVPFQLSSTFWFRAAAASLTIARGRVEWRPQHWSDQSRTGFHRNAEGELGSFSWPSPIAGYLLRFNLVFAAARAAEDCADASGIPASDPCC